MPARPSDTDVRIQALVTKLKELSQTLYGYSHRQRRKALTSVCDFPSVGLHEIFEVLPGMRDSAERHSDNRIGRSSLDQLINAVFPRSVLPDTNGKTTIYLSVGFLGIVTASSGKSCSHNCNSQRTGCE